MCYFPYFLFTIKPKNPLKNKILVVQTENAYFNDRLLSQKPKKFSYLTRTKFFKFLIYVR